MTEVDLAQTAPQRERVAELAASRWRDLTSRAAIVVVFSALAAFAVAGLVKQFPLAGFNGLLGIAASVANILFLTLVASTALTRLAPLRKARGVEPRVTALLGTFLSTGLAILPKADLGPLWSTFSILLTIVGASLSFMVLRRLGKSFSIMAEARRLVTDGPYGVVRHPLYLSEGIAVIGAAMRAFSPWSILLAVAFAGLQYRRMINEEAILKAAFPEYQGYAQQTPRIVPRELMRNAALMLLRKSGGT